MTVFVVQENNYMDYTPAEDFGEVRFLTVDEYRPISSSLRNLQILEDIRKGLKDFDPEKDYIVFTGNPVVMGYAFHQLFSRFPEFRILHWRSKENRYQSSMFKERDDNGY